MFCESLNANKIFRSKAGGEKLPMAMIMHYYSASRKEYVVGENHGSDRVVNLLITTLWQFCRVDLEYNLHNSSSMN